MRKEKSIYHDETVHICKGIHWVITWYDIALFFIIIIMGTSFLPIFRGPFFDFSAPFVILGQTVTNNAALVVVMLFFFVVQLLATFADEISNWSSIFDAAEARSGLWAADEHAARAHYHWRMLHKTVNTIMYWFRQSAMIAFMRVEISFVLAFVVADILAFYIARRWSIVRREEYAEKSPKQPEIEQYEKSALLVSLLQIVAMPGFVVVYMIMGVIHQPFFDIGPPLTVFSTTVTNPAVYAYIVIALFADSLIMSLARNIVENWHMYYLQNTAKLEHELLLSRNEAIGVFMLKRVMLWLRIVFVYNFLASQFFMIFVYIAADLIGSLVTTHDYLVPIHEDAVQTASRPRSKKRAAWSRFFEISRDSVFGLMIVQTIETVVLVMIIAIAGVFDITYFDWVRSATIFDNTITNLGQRILLLVIIGLQRIGATGYNDVIIPDYTNWLYSKGQAPGNTRSEDMAIMFITRVDYLFRYVLLIQFVLSNIYFVLVAAIVDIVLGIVILSRYIRHKARACTVKESLHIMKDRSLDVFDIYEDDSDSSPDDHERSETSLLEKS